jgi:hypothetical protein
MLLVCAKEHSMYGQEQHRIQTKVKQSKNSKKKIDIPFYTGLINFLFFFHKGSARNQKENDD